MGEARLGQRRARYAAKRQVHSHIGQRFGRHRALWIVPSVRPVDRAKEQHRGGEARAIALLQRWLYLYQKLAHAFNQAIGTREKASILN